ncbi:TRPM8 channel-associated factor homolog [Gouania willdenowi]|uniref:TRPM8 channel-associated factor homolog n=1 Tax=Gouania willdenowi TaxID=441366 RepID=A0A8C5DPS7_GOUWI|nr:TRPM8 channel-associated factor homolog [Gouania willdenowi]XP_028321252.1 TRPM8 channel-associated factor homolog [Gouania willdenowi]
MCTFGKSKKDPHEDYYLSLVKGIKEFDLRALSVPSDLVLIGDHAFPLVMNSKGQAFMAASLYGSGRIVVLGHEDYLTNFPVLVENAVTWLRGAGSDNLSVGVHTNVKAVAENLKGFKPEVVEAFKEKPGVGVYVTDAYNVGADTKDLVKYIKNGGGVLIAGQACQWASHNSKDNTLHTFPGNTVAGVTGIYFSDDPGEREVIPVHHHIPTAKTSIVFGKNFTDDMQFLLQGVPEFEIRHGITCSELLVHGRLSFPIGATGANQVFLAAGYYGQGRIIVASHEGLLKQENMSIFWKNALLWLDEGRQGIVGVENDKARKILSQSGLKCEKTGFKAGLSVYVSPSDIKNGDEIVEYVTEGGGLLVAGHAWWWGYTHKELNVLVDFRGNQVLNRMGISILGKTVSSGTYKAPNPSTAIEDMYHFRYLLYRFAGSVMSGVKLLKKEKDWLQKLSIDCTTFLEIMAYDSSSFTQVVSILTYIFKDTGLPKVSEHHPVKTPEERVLLTLIAAVYNAASDQDSLKCCFPKNDTELPAVYDQKLKIDVDTAGAMEWMSTGLYLSPCMGTILTVPKEIINKGWKIQIGCHTDFIKCNELKRAPCVHEQFPIKSEIMMVQNLWGGLLYLLVPPKTKVNGMEIKVETAVAAPYFKQGVTTEAEWEKIRSLPAPWAELELENIILTVPSEVIRDLEYPVGLVEYWEKITHAMADLAAIPHKFSRKERFVADVQIAYGWMHAGYPIMIHKSSAHDLVHRYKDKGKGLWGPIHELGHNQQKSCWEFTPHTTEATCNLWTVYVHENVMGINRGKAHGALHPDNRKKRMDEYVKGGRHLNSWNMWTALETYLQLQEKFGWSALKKVFEAYHTMTNIPKDNNGKMNLYAVTFSEIVQMNLTEFLKAWGWPIVADTETKLSSLPVWKDHPMVQYD